MPSTRWRSTTRSRAGYQDSISHLHARLRPDQGLIEPPLPARVLVPGDNLMTYNLSFGSTYQVQPVGPAGQLLPSKLARAPAGAGGCAERDQGQQLRGWMVTTRRRSSAWRRPTPRGQAPWPRSRPRARSTPEWAPRPTRGRQRQQPLLKLIGRAAHDLASTQDLDLDQAGHRRHGTLENSTWFSYLAPGRGVLPAPSCSSSRRCPSSPACTTTSPSSWTTSARTRTPPGWPPPTPARWGRGTSRARTAS